ncbi:MAG: hypothetical protein COW85_02540 [Ignavibacteria bacterium CG22_combo_CG10-13_8_21_14_all_37_15]|nr:MAG: hypothetical protein COW85_02540 [Ignavibacteria bacterium CG22_combo_CG10-13_8_21_14_all_37_15]
MKKISLVLVMWFLVCSQISFAQESSNNKIFFPGNLHADSKVLFESSGMQTQNISFPSPDKKSPMIAGLLSLLLPGAGEFYTESYWKAAAFAAVEVSAIVVAVSYNKKGDTQTSTFEQYADGHWSIKRYAEWTINNVAFINSSVDAAQYSVINTDGSVNHAELNRLERDLGSGYSHALPQHGDQQYYELIGKYPQYSHGWDDANQSETDFHILSPNFLDYSKMRGKANDYYNLSDKAVIGLYVNHFLSGLDAVWSAFSFNKDIAVKFRVNQINAGTNLTFYPTVYLQYSF